MRSYRIILLTMLMPIVTLVSYAQCPANEDALADGGTFSGDCSVFVDLVINVTGTVNWTSGTLTITGSSGRLRVANGAIINIHAGSIVTVDDGNDSGTAIDGPVEIQNGGTINVYSGASLVAAERITVSGALNIYGNVSSLISGLTIPTGGSVLISAGSNLTTSGTGDNLIEGTLAVAGTFNASGDLEINGGDVTIQNDGSLNVTGADGDLFVYGNGSLTIEQGGEVAVADGFSNVDDVPALGPPGGIINIAGELSIGEDLNIINTTPNSQLLGTASGQITVAGSVSDAECPTYSEGVYTFCDCDGNGETCGAVLPIELVSFTAAHQQGNVLLEWSTASEFNNSHFTVERFNDIDEIISLIDVPGKGTTTEVNHYRFIDITPQAGHNYYRLKQVDFNGAIAYSAAVRTEVASASQQLTLSINPAEQKLLYINASGLKPNVRVPISIVAANGSTCFFEYITTNEAGVLLSEIDLSTLTPGLYIVKAATLHAKFVK